MARINQFEALCDDLHREAVKKGIVRKPARLAKSVGPLEAFCAKAQAAGGRVTIREQTSLGDKVAISGKKAEKVAAGSHPGLRHDLKWHVESREVSPEDLRGPLSEGLLRRLVADCKSGKIELNSEDMDNLDKAFRAGNAIPAYLIKRLQGQ
jgi:hypothetical protein